MLQSPVTCLAKAVATANAIARERLKRAKEDAHRFIENGETNQHLIKQKIKQLSLFPDDEEARQLIARLAEKSSVSISNR
jgi:hypothetical protein